jgi:hypothetical protein
MRSRGYGGPDALDSTFGSVTAGVNRNTTESNCGHACSRTRANGNRQCGISQRSLPKVFRRLRWEGTNADLP